MKHKNIRWRTFHGRLNKILFLVVLVLGLYLILFPIVPAISFWWSRANGFTPTPYVATAIQKKQMPDGQMPLDNRLAIPSIGLDEKINDGDNLRTANKGVWRLPKSSSPDVGGNTVLTGHRFSYSPNSARVFYNLDKVKPGDDIYIFWLQKTYRYEVTTKEVVNPDKAATEISSNDTRLTLYTGSPLWTSKNRLVIMARLVGDNE
jgi:LPXTG-site transpeptidase (sortase) family protein